MMNGLSFKVEYPEPGVVRFCLFYDNEEIAFTIINYNVDKAGPWLTNLYVKPAYRNRGYAKLLLNTVKTKIKRRPLFLKVWAYEDNTKSDDELIAMYKMFGFKEIPNNPKKLRLDESFKAFFDKRGNHDD